MLNINNEDALRLAGVQPQGQKVDQRLDCPFCGKKKRLSLNMSKGVFRCWTPSCDANEGGTFLDLIALSQYGTGKFKALEKQQKHQILTDLGADELPQRNQRVVQMPRPAEPVVARDETLNVVYSTLLNLLTLSKDDEEELLERGLSADAIVRNGYKSLTLNRVAGMDEYIDLHQRNWQKLLKDAKFAPNTKQLKTVAYGLRLARQVIEAGVSPGALYHTPGFFKFDGQPCLRVITGMVIPVRSETGSIVRLCIHDKKREAKYMSLSSNGLPCGTPAAARVHVPLGSSQYLGDYASDKLLVTEGILKADVATFLFGNRICSPLVGVPGVDCLRDIPKLIQVFHAKVVFDLFDADKVLNPGVNRGCQNLAEIAAKSQARYRTLFWDRKEAMSKLRELYRLSRKCGMAVPESLKRAVSARKAPQNPWLMVQELAFELWPNRKNLPDATFKWASSSKGIDDFLLHLQKNEAKDFYVI